MTYEEAQLFDQDEASLDANDTLRSIPDRLARTSTVDEPVIARSHSDAPDNDRAFDQSIDDDRLPVKVIRSARRKKTVEARLNAGVLEVLIPANLSAEDEAHWVEEMSKRIERRRSSKTIDLTARATKLANEYDLPIPTQIRFVSNQKHRWGSCTVAGATRGHIRISDRLAGFPDWVLDYVIVHELAHLIEVDHSPAFFALAERYPLCERARGFLIAKGLDG